MCRFTWLQDLKTRLSAHDSVRATLELALKQKSDVARVAEEKLRKAKAETQSKDAQLMAAKEAVCRVSSSSRLAA